MSKTKQAKRPLTQAEKRNKTINRLWLLLSLTVALVVLYLLSIGEKTARSFPFSSQSRAGIPCSRALKP